MSYMTWKPAEIEREHQAEAPVGASLLGNVSVVAINSS